MTEDVRFKHHPPTSDNVADTHHEVRLRFSEVAHWLEENVPNCRERSVALTNLETAMMWSNAAVARTQLKEQPPRQ